MNRAKRLLILSTMAVAATAAISISASATELKTGIGVVETSLRLRESASSDSDTISIASPGDNVVIIREVDGWYLVDYNLDIGYMSADYITFKERENVELGDGRINTSSVNLRSSPPPPAIWSARCNTAMRPTSSVSTAAGIRSNLRDRPVTSEAI